MNTMRAKSIPIRVALALLLAAILAVRSLVPAGYMPKFDRGSVSVIVCPDGGMMGGMPMHHSGDPKSMHEQCPYAGASALGGMPPQWPAELATEIPQLLRLLGRTSVRIEFKTAFERPPPIGPPIAF